MGLLYLGAAQYVIWLNDPVNAGAGYWPAAGVTLAALLLLPTRRWGWVVAAAVVAEIGGGVLRDYPLEASSWWAAGNVVEPLVAALLLRRFARDGRLAPIGDLVWFLAAGVVVGPLVGAAIGSVGTSVAYDRSWFEVFLKWWAGDGLGVLVVAPLLLCFREVAPPRRSRVELAALAIVVVGVPLLAFRGWSRDWDATLPYIVFPLLGWAGVRFGLRGAATAGFAVAEVANLATALGYGPFELAAGSDGHAVTVLQIVLGSALSASLVLATLVSDAVNRTRQYERQRSVAETLQVAALPESLPSVPGLELAARYAPADRDAAIHVGGDWYDAFPLPDGSTALVVGDVAGHDLDAAAVMSQLRNGLRSLLLELGEPDRVMAALDRQLTAARGPVTTAVIAVYADGELCWSNAGHPPLLVRRAGGSVEYLDDDPRLLLGTGRADFDLRRTAIEPGDTVIAYTDGLVEHRSWSLVEGFEHLAGMVTTASALGPEELCDLLLAEGLDGRRREDDVCLLVLRRVR